MPNDDQREYWNEQAGPKWVEHQARLDIMLAPVDSVLINAADPKAGQRMLDIGCGTGAISEKLADQGAVVTGIDLSETMITGAQFRASDNLVFQTADAGKFSSDVPFASAVSRFGVMFFDDPYAAFANIHSSLEPGGKIIFVCWQAPNRNSWAAVPAMAIESLLEEAPPADPHAPGPFAFADPDRITDILGKAGFHNISIEEHDIPIMLSSSSLDDATDFSCQIGPGSRAMTKLGEADKPKARNAIREALSQHVAENGSVTMDGGVWLVTAHAYRP